MFQMLKLLLLIGAATSALATAQGPAELAQKVAAAMETNSEKARAYAYRQHQITVRMDKNGKEIDRNSKTWDVIGLEGSRYRKLVERDDKPLPPREAEKQEQAMRAEAAKRRADRSAGRRLFSTSYSLSIPYRTLSRVYDLTLSGEEEIGGRAVFVLKGTPKASQNFTAREREAANYTIRLWVEKGSGYPVRTAMKVITDKSRMRKGTTLQREDFQSEDGTWLPRAGEISFVLKVVGTFTLWGVSAETFSEFKKFQVDSKMTVEDR